MEDNVKILCRTCKKVITDDYVLLVNTIVMNKTECLLKEMLKAITGLEFNAGENLPNKTCAECVFSITEAYTFYQKACESEKFFSSAVICRSADEVKLEEKHEIDEEIEPSLEIQHQSNVDDVEFKSEIDSELDEEYIDNEFDEAEFLKEEYDDEPLSRIQTPLEIQPQTDYIVDELLREMNSKSYTPTIPLSCPICNREFKHLLGLKHHVDVHRLVEIYECKVCGVKNRRYITHLRHVRIHRATANKCQECGKVFAHDFQLRRHVKSNHANTECTSKCDICNEVFEHQMLLELHLKKMHLTLNYADHQSLLCHICGKDFKQKGCLSTHLKFHDKSQFKCDYCSKTFGVRQALERHLTVHTGELAYECPICNKRFSRMHSLKLHKQGHTGDSGYKAYYRKKPRKSKTTEAANVK